MLPFLPHLIIAVAYGAWGLGKVDDNTMYTWVSIGHGFAPLWAGLIAIPARPWRAYLACVGTILAGHVAAMIALVVLGGHAVWSLVAIWLVATLVYAASSAVAFGLVVAVRRART